MEVYALDVLIEQSRQLARDYYRSTKQTLPLSGEIAKFDAIRILRLQAAQSGEAGVDAYDEFATKIQIKSRVIFDTTRSGYRIGQLNFEGLWEKIFLVLLDENYIAQFIYVADRHALEQELLIPTKRGAMSISKFKKLGYCIWQRELEESVS